MLKILYTLLIGISPFLINAQIGDNNSTGTKMRLNTSNTYAIIIGASEYPILGKQYELNYADDDALLIQNYLTSWNNTAVKVFLNDSTASKEKIGLEIENTLMKKALPGDKVIIFFSGHGDVDATYNQGYLLLNQVKPLNEACYKFNDALKLSDIKESINIAGEKGVEVYIIIDACHAGDFLSKSSNDLLSGMDEKSIKMISCKKGQFAQENAKLGHGVFTYHLIEGMAGLANKDDNEDISLYELENYVREKVRIETAGEQQPVFEGADENIKISKTNEEILKMLKDEKKSQEIASNVKKKSVRDPYEGFSSRCLALIRLLDEKTATFKFFTNELDSIDKQTISASKSVSSKNHTKLVSAVAFSPDGKSFISGNEDGLALYKTHDIKHPTWIKEISGKITCLSYSPNGNTFASGTIDKSLIIWDEAEGEKLFTMPKFSKEITAIKYITENLIAVGTVTGAIILWDTETGKKVTIKAHKGRVNDVELNYPLLYSVGNDGKVSVFDLEKKKNVTSFIGHSDIAVSIKILQYSNALLSVGLDGKLKKWNLSSLKLERDLDLKITDINDLDVDPFESYCFIGSKDKKALVVDLSNLQKVKLKSASTSGIARLMFDPIDNNLLMGEYDGSVSIQKIKVQPENSSADEIINQLAACSNSSQKEDFDKLLLMSLNSSVSIVLNDLVNGSKNSSDSTKIEQAIVYAKKALEIGQKLNYKVSDLEVNLHLLEVYSVINANEKSKYNEALEKVKKIEQIDPNGAYVYNLAAILNLKLNNIEVAKKMASKAEELAPVWSEATNNYGEILLISGDIKGAEIKFKQTIDKSPQLAKGYIALGDLYFNQKRFLEAKVYLEKGIKINPTNIVLTELYTETIAEFEKSKNTPTNINKLKIGDAYAGGVIFSLDKSGKHGLVCVLYVDGELNWSDAMKVCNDLTLEGYTDWRLPTIEELNKCSKNRHLIDDFIFMDGAYWTSSQTDGQYAIWKHILNGKSDKSLKTNLRYVEAVRSF
jgi:WD40 repeat protein